MSALETKLHELCLALAPTWGDNRLLSSQSKSIPKAVITHTDDAAALLPHTKRPIRGYAAVKVDVRDREPDPAEVADYLVQAALEPPWSPRDDPEIKAARALLDAKLEEVLSEFREMDRLPARLFEAFTFKHYEPNEIERRLDQGAERTVLWRLLLCTAMGRALASLDFNPDKKLEFDRWAEVAHLVAQDFESLAQRTRHKYRVIIGLNAPLIDNSEEAEVASLELYGESISVKLFAASDELLARLAWSEPDTPVAQINTAIGFHFSVDVNAPVDHYLRVYSAAILIAERTTDLLRLLCDDDLGVLTLEVLRPDWAPVIRKTYERRYRAELAPYEPRRFRFGPPSGQILAQKQLQKLQSLLGPYLRDEIEVKGLGAAMRRLRASFERYQPADAERLLDLAIAFEAAILNDLRETQELGYRLRLRAARYLGRDPRERDEIFEVLRDLYGFRSRIAHGETLDEMNTAERAKLVRVTEQAPKILKQTLLKVMEQQELRGLAKEKLAAWWRGIELG